MHKNNNAPTPRPNRHLRPAARGGGGDCLHLPLDEGRGRVYNATRKDADGAT